VASTRDRDRLRYDELRELGWHMHRIWSTAWYLDPEAEQQRLYDAIRRALVDPVGVDQLASPEWGAPYRPVAGELLPPEVETADQLDTL
jgi:hypothetical protein